MMPVSENGMSSHGHSRDMTPFWPWREANLSPGTGLRLKRSLMLARSHDESLASVPSRRTSSTTASSVYLCFLAVCRPVVESMTL